MREEDGGGRWFQCLRDWSDVANLWQGMILLKRIE